MHFLNKENKIYKKIMSDKVKNGRLYRVLFEFENMSNESIKELHWQALLSFLDLDIKNEIIFIGCEKFSNIKNYILAVYVFDTPSNVTRLQTFFNCKVKFAWLSDYKLKRTAKFYNTVNRFTLCVNSKDVKDVLKYLYSMNNKNIVKITTSQTYGSKEPYYPLESMSNNKFQTRVRDKVNIFIDIQSTVINEDKCLMKDIISNLPNTEPIEYFYHTNKFKEKKLLSYE